MGRVGLSDRSVMHWPRVDGVCVVDRGTWPEQPVRAATMTNSAITRGRTPAF